MAETSTSSKKGCAGWIIVGVILLGLFIWWSRHGHGPVPVGVKVVQEVDGVAQARAIVAGLTAYAKDHHGDYPDGTTSTEVFQKLLDDGYVSDPGTFYAYTGGKFPADSKRLRSINVSFDYTAGAKSQSPDDLPLVFTSGYDMTYVADGIARRSSDIAGIVHGMAIGYKNGKAHFRRASSDGSVGGIFSDDFDAHGETYRQLKP